MWCELEHEAEGAPIILGSFPCGRGGPAPVSPTRAWIVWVHHPLTVRLYQPNPPSWRNQ